MSTRHDRDKNKTLLERHQMILTQLLKDEDNKYCVDCDAKGPRWGSWNLGIFLCIRCAGIHRNMGVHISKVKSVNLDSWTSEQIAMVQEMGNSRARAVYEANLPDNFRRPQTDSGLEAFIRSKYEHKKYIAHEWIPPQPKIPTYTDDAPKKEKKKSRPKPAASVNLTNPPTNKPSSNSVTKSSESKTPSATQKPASKTKPSAAVDLLGLDTPAAPAATGSSSDDLFGDFMGSATSAPVGAPESTPGAETSTSNGLDDVNLLAESSDSQQKQKSTKESILALYGSGGGGGGGGQMFGVPGGMYMLQQGQQPQQQMWAAGGPVPNGMMANQANAMMANQANGMMANQATAMMANQAVNMQANMGMMTVPANNIVASNQQQMMLGGQPATNMSTQQMYGGAPAQAMYGVPQVQNQMASMNLGGVGQQPGMVAAGGGMAAAGANWPTQSSGQTLSNNLWQ